MSYDAIADPLAPNSQRLSVIRDGAPLDYGDALSVLEADAGFRRFLTEALAQAPFDAFFWETPPLSETSLDRPFEFVLTESPALAARRPDPKPFADHFREGDPVAVFPSLGGDAMLVAPSQEAAPAAYPHLAAFLRGAPAEQIDALWRATASAMQESLSDAPRWLSTSGLGVPWLHVRIDSRPKYYVHAPYRQAP